MSSIQNIDFAPCVAYREHIPSQRHTPAECTVNSETLSKGLVYGADDVRELRKLLFQVQNQNMTVRELRQALTNLDDQDAPVTDDLLWNVGI